MIYIDKYAYISGLKDTSPVFKILFAIITLFVCVASNKLLVYDCVFIVMLAITVIKAKIPLDYYIKLLLIPTVFLMLSVIGIILNISFSNPQISCLKIASMYFFISQEGIGKAIYLASKAMASVSCLYFLILTTPMRDIIHFLYRLKLPLVLIEQFTLIYRFIFILLDKTLIKRNSQLCRFGYLGYRNGIKSFASLFASVFVEAFMQSEQVYNAMLSRGYTGEMKFLPKSYNQKKLDWIMLACFEIFLVLLNFLS